MQAVTESGCICQQGGLDRDEYLELSAIWEEFGYAEPTQEPMRT